MLDGYKMICRNSIVCPESLTLFLPTLFDKRVLWVFCPLSIKITMLLILFVLELFQSQVLSTGKKEISAS